MASFAGISWGERGDDGELYPAVSAKMIGTIHRPPDGNAKILHTRTVKERTLTTGARLTVGQLAALRAAAGSIDTLAFSWGSLTAMLQGVNAPAEVLASEIVFCTLHFRIFSGYGGSAYGSLGYGE